MASGASGRAQSGSKGFDFASDDILCSFEDYGNNNNSASNGGANSDTIIGTTNSSTKDYQKTRMARSSVYSGAGYVQPEDSYNVDVTATVERTMKKYADNIMRFLEGISSRLSQLELYCYNVDKTVGEIRSNLTHDHGEADTKLKSLEKHLQEVHRAVQIIKDKQELVETQKELAKLQLANKDTSAASSRSHSYEERVSSPASDPKKTDNSFDAHNQQLALALAHQVAPHQQHVPQTSQAPVQNSTPQQSYYLQANHLPNVQATVAAHTPSLAPQHPSHPPPLSAGATAQQPQQTYMPSDAQYRTPQMQELQRVAPQPAQSQANVVSQGLQFSQYQPHWQQSVTQQQMRPLSTTIYQPYTSTQSTNPSIPELPPNSMAMHVSYSGVPQQLPSHGEMVPYGYAAPVRTVPQQQPASPHHQQVKGNFGPQSGDGYTPRAPHTSIPQMTTYAVFETDGTRAHQQIQPPQFSQNVYPPANTSFQNPQPNSGVSMMVRNPNHPQLVRNHPYNDLMEKLVNMGFRSDHVASVIQRMEESGQPVDFNAVLDRLNVQAQGGGW